MKGQKYPPPRTIAIDVDKTLFNAGAVDSRLVAWIRQRHAEGFEIIIWSSRGTEYAIKAAELAGLNGIVTAAISKPGYIVDDQGWGWIKHTVVIDQIALQGHQ